MELLRSCSGRNVHSLQLSSGVIHKVLGISSSSRFLTHPQLLLCWVPFHKTLQRVALSCGLFLLLIRELV